MRVKHLVVVCDTHEQAAEAVKTLVDDVKFNKRHISVIGKGEDKEPKSTFEVEKENKDIIFWGEQGVLWGGVMGFLMGAFASFVPGFGPIVAAGPIISSLAGALSGSAIIGSGAALISWFVDLGIEEEEAHKYKDYLKEGKIVILAESKDEKELENAKAALEKSGCNESKIYEK